MDNWQAWEKEWQTFLLKQLPDDGAHDLTHVQRVVANARRLAKGERADLAVVLPAAWLHDCVTIPKNSPDRPRASRLASKTAVAHLRATHYPQQHHDAIAHAIEAHSFSAGISPQTIEAQVVQDADRLDALGAIGIARTFIIGGKLNRPIYDPDDPFCQDRPADDNMATIDHFYTKLLTLADTMQTAVGRQIAHQRTQYMLDFLAQMADEISQERSE